MRKRPAVRPIKTPSGLPAGSTVTVPAFSFLVAQADQIALRTGWDRFAVVNAALAAGIAALSTVGPREMPS
ncbi:MAG: hypothetical protein ACYC4P_11625 [Thermoanaerobaculia bacterium]